MKVTAATGGTGKVIFYDITTDAGTIIGSAITNDSPLDDDKVITIEDARKNAMLWAAAPDLFETLLEVNNRYASLMTKKMRNKIQSAINKAKGI